MFSSLKAQLWIEVSRAWSPIRVAINLRSSFSIHNQFDLVLPNTELSFVLRRAFRVVLLSGREFASVSSRVK